MNLLRTPLLDALPGVREGLHSAVLTTYSFDFYFFEKVLLRRLRSIGIRNVVVLADATMLHEATRYSSNFGDSRSKTYNLVPIDCGGAFHPKTLMLLGEKSGWLAIGSGNITESGHGKNDEIWGAFYCSSSNLSHQNLFAGVWEFIKILESNHLSGFAKKQIADAEQFAPWIGNLPQPVSGKWWKTENDTDIMLLHSGSASTIWNQLIHNLPHRSIQCISVFSPFFDENGFALQKLSESFPNAALRVVTEPVWGQLPLKLKQTVQSQTLFFDWKTLTEVPSKSTNRWLHAKIIVFETESEGNFCFFGSSNTTPAGLGIGGTNHEMNLLLYSSTLSFLATLGLDLVPEVAVELSGLAISRQSTITNPGYGIVFETLISAVEIDGTDIQVFVSKPLNKTVRLVLFDAEGIEIQSVDTVFESRVASFRFSGNKRPVTCQIFDLSTEQPCSNSQIIVSLPDLRKTHPDPVRAKWETLMDNLRDGENQALIDILPLLDLEAPVSSEARQERGIASENEADESLAPASEESIQLTEEEFTRIPDENIYRSQTLHLDPARDLSNFLLQIRLDKPDADEDIDTDADEELLDAETGERKDRVTIGTPKKVKPDTTDQEATAFKVFLGRYRKVLSNAVVKYLREIKASRPTPPLTSRNLSHFLIAVRLMIRYGDRKQKDRPQALSVLPLQHGLTQTWEPKKVNSVQIACYEIIGKMLLLLNAGVQPAHIKQEESRLLDLKNAIFFDAVFLFAGALDEKSEYTPLFFYNLFLHFPESRILDAAYFRTQLESRGKFGTGISVERLSRLLEEFQKSSQYFYEHFENKDLQKRHRITIENKRYYLLEKPFGISLAENDKFDPRYHPGGVFNEKGYYCLDL